MKVQIDTTETLEVDLSPRQLGKLFSGLDADEQAEFLQGVYEGVRKWPKDGPTGYGEAQWYALARTLKAEKLRHAQRTLMAMAASCYRFADQKVDVSYLWWLEHECPDVNEDELRRAKKELA